MNTKQLRQKILDLAIRGKLVPQDPNDEPASVLLERIKAEKEKLIKEGKIKRPKKSATTADKPHYPFEIPDSWEWTRLDDFVMAVTDGDHLPPPQAPNGVPFLVISDVNTGRISFEKARFVSDEYYKSLPDIRKAQEGDLLFTVTGSYGIVIPVTTNRDFCFQRHIGLIKTITSSTWIRFVLQSNYVQSYCDSIATGTAQKTVSLGHLRNLLVPIPPENEQKRIICELEVWLNKVHIIQKSKCDLEQLLGFAKSKILELAISGKLVPQDPADEPAEELLRRINPSAVPADKSHYKFDIPNNWMISHLGDLFNHNTGKALNRSNQDGAMLDYITTSNLYWDRFELDNLKQMCFKENEINKCSVEKGDLLVCEGGDIGRAAIWSYNYSICIQNHIHKLRPLDIHLVYPRFYYYCFFLYKQQNLIGGKGIGIQGLSSNQLHKVIFPLPPLDEQKRIVAKIDELFNVINQIQQSLEA